MLDINTDIGITFALSPEDTNLYLDMITKGHFLYCYFTENEGPSIAPMASFNFSRSYFRLGMKKPLQFAMDIAIHDSNWRSK